MITQRDIPAFAGHGDLNNPTEFIPRWQKLNLEPLQTLNYKDVEERLPDLWD